MAPDNVSPLVVWLGSAESSDVTGRMFEVEAGIIRVAEGWAHGPQVDKGARWEPAELGPVVADCSQRPGQPVPVYGAYLPELTPPNQVRHRRCPSGHLIEMRRIEIAGALVGAMLLVLAGCGGQRGRRQRGIGHEPTSCTVTPTRG